MNEKQEMCTVVDLPTSIWASLFAALMFTGIHKQFPLLPMLKGINQIDRLGISSPA